MQQSLIDAARAVIAADRAGELTDEMYESFTAAIEAYQHPDDLAGKEKQND
ncbi:hypothetical protein [Chromobacterium haemolyticum]|uniref:hypothetical protein n=1 Tax=Chromobacterium haemolyticum TaxID=394935 RepID=UPI0015C4159F|nr:hypothetical protein [Chromobacterium haemolyticum]